MQLKRKPNDIINQSKLNACEAGKNTSYIAINDVNFWQLTETQKTSKIRLLMLIENVDVN